MIFSKNIKIAVLLAICSYFPATAFAWGMIGHRVVGQVAETYLSKKSRKAVKDILGGETLAISSNWPDFIKSDPAYDYLNSWHYVNLPAGLNQKDVFSFLAADTTTSVYTKIPEMIAILKNKQSTIDQKKMAMRLLVHMVGDLHQPMHTARKEDLGGNRVSVTWFGSRSNLHRVWDENLVEYQELSYTEYAQAINHPTKAQLSAWRSASLPQSVFESYEVVEKIYANIKPDDKLSYRYNFDYADILNEQLLKGGVRLAQIINQIYA
jgi:hypothetical protein